MSKTQYCDECQFHQYRTGKIAEGAARRSDDTLRCLRGHKPRFYHPKNGNFYNSSWGYKRRCDDFVVGEHVQVININPAMSRQGTAV